MVATGYRPSESDRWPLASRKWRLSVALAGWLAGRGVRANAISLMFVVTLTALAAAVVPGRWQAQLVAVGSGLPAIALGVISAGCLITAARRLSRAARALRARMA